MTEKQLFRLLRLPPRKLEVAFDRLSDLERQRAVSGLDGLAEYAAFRAGYAAERYGYGCGDRGHARAVKRANRQGRGVWRRVLGYNAYHEVNF